MNPFRLFYCLICLIFLLFVLPLSNAQTPPQATIISGPSGITEYEDVTFWWINDSFTPIIGYYYELDNRGRVFTESNRVSFFGLDAGTHTFRVSGVDANGVEDETPDERHFQVGLVPQIELEFNDVSSLSTFVRLNHQLRGASINEGDLDWYKFQIPRDGHLISICLKRAGGIGQTTAQVYRGSTSDTNKIAELIVDESNAQRECITLGVVEGDYFILVQAQTVDADFDEYFLTVPLVS
ncbi:hypothetical protein IH992_27185, partial [Candidatus Poribacteria bacterium]|nr:hypothetical protein [Candidatus Poribacteria bacterium]